MHCFISNALFNVPNTKFRLKRVLVADFSTVAKDDISGLALWRHRTWFVPLRERGVSALWRHISRLFLYAQIGTKVIFTSE